MAATRLPWLGACVTAISAVVAAVLGGESLQYDRVMVHAGQWWRLVTGQMVHWSPGMAIADLGAVFILAAWLELRGHRRGAVLALGLGTVLTAVCVQWISSEVSLFRGASGVASSLFVLLALDILFGARGWSGRGVAAVAISLFFAKATWELAGGPPVAAGPLPEGVRVVPLVHLAGGAAGVFAFALDIGFRRRLDTHPRHDRT